MKHSYINLEPKFKVGEIYEDEFLRTYRFKYKGNLYEFDEVMYDEKRGKFITYDKNIRLTVIEARHLKPLWN